MNSPLEKARLTRDQKRKQAQAEIAALTGELKNLLDDPSPVLDALDRQAAVLDKLLYAFMRDNLKKDLKNGGFGPQGLHDALRIQKQCVDTLKTAGALNYMHALGRGLPKDLTHAPLPPESQKQKEGS